MSLWKNNTPPILYPDAVATPAGWADPVTGELYVTVTGLSTFKNESAGTQLVSARILGAKSGGVDPIVNKPILAAGDIMVVEAIFLEQVTVTGGTPTMTITLNGNARTFTQFTDTSDYVLHTQGKVTAFTIGIAGSGYVVGDKLTFTGGAGSSASAVVATVSGGGGITGITLLNGGAGYTSAPTVGVTSTAGTSASITATVGQLANGAGTNRWLFGYTIASSEVSTAAQIVFPASVTGVFNTTIDGLGTSAAATAVIGQGVTSISVGTPGSGYTSAPDVTFTGGSPATPATAVAVLDKGVATVVVSAGGSGYTSAPTVGFTSGGGSGATATAVLATTGAVKSVTVSGSGTGYTNGDAVIFTGGSGSGAAGTINVTAGNITSVTITNGGSGYATAPTITLTTPGGSGNTLTAVLGKAVASVTVTGAGTGYTSVPTVGFSSGGGTGAAATATLSNLQTVKSVSITNPGSGYTGTPTIGFANGGGSGAAATATATKAVQSVTVTNPGSKYWNVPTIAFSGGGGSGAAATAVMDRGTVSSVTITNFGSGYTSAPSVAFSEATTSVTNPSFVNAPVVGNFRVDGVAPTISSVNITGYQSSNVLITNNVVTIAVTTSKAVYVTGSPYISMTIGSGTPHAVYQQGSGSNVLIFTYEIASGDTATAGNFSISSPIHLNSGTIKDLQGNNLTLTFSAPTTSSVTVNNAVLPTISSVTLAGGPAYVTSNTLTFTVHGSENLYVSTTFGVPQIPIFINNYTQFAAYLSGSGTNALLFGYTVTALDKATAGTFSTGTSIEMNGGNITDINSVNLNGTFTRPSTGSVTIN